MSGVFAEALGDDFARLHPMMQKRFGVGLETGYACTGTGVMDEIRRGAWWTVPFLSFGRLRNVLVPKTGERVPFTIENYPYRDPFGRETVTFVRTFDFPGGASRFDATMVGDRGRVVDYLGTHQHLAVPLDLQVDHRGGLVLRTDAQWFYEGRVGFSFPLALSGRATLHEHFDEEAQRFRIQLMVRHERYGFLFGYRGGFVCEFHPADDAPRRLRPVRHERRLPPL